MSIAPHPSSTPSLTPRFGNQAATRTLVRASEALFATPGKLTAAEKMATAGFFERRGRKLLAMLTQHDWTETPRLAKNMLAAEPPIGSMILLLYPFTIGARYLRAMKRDKSGTEKNDVLRRDMTAITIFLFLLKPLVNSFNMIRERFSPLKLVEKNPKDLLGKTYSYAQLEQMYKINNANKLVALVSEGNGPGLEAGLKFIERKYRNVIGHLPQGEAFLEEFATLRGKASELMSLYEASLRTGKPAGAAATISPEVRQAAAELFGMIEKAQKRFDKQFTTLALDTTASGRGHLAKAAKTASLLPKLEDSLVALAKRRCLPSSILSFITVVFAIGWFPVWFNDQLSKKRRNQQSAAQRAADAQNFDPRAAYQSLKESSKLSANLAGNPFRL